jgi:serine/threonine protein kinase
MSDRPLQIEKFASAIRQLKILDSLGLEKFISSAKAASDRSLIELLSQIDQVTPQHIDMVDVLARGDEAIPGYLIQDVIGCGGMGVVWRAKQKSLDRFVALKTISANLRNNPQAIARFEREAVAIAKLSHPNIVTALDFGRHQNRLFLAREVVNGQDLGNFLEQSGALPEMVAWGIARQVASGLFHASREGVIHRDIKPANILILNDTHSGISPTGVPAVKITDFGLALLNAADQPVDARLTSTGAAIGSPHYMAPEQFGGTSVDTRTDVYALGATVFQMLTGEPPWNGKSLPQIMGYKLSGSQPPFDNVIFKVNPKTLNLVQRMMACEIDRRPENCSQLLSEIDQVIAALAKRSPDANEPPGKFRQPPNSSGSLDDDDTTEFQVVDVDLVSAIVGASSIPTRELSAAWVEPKSAPNMNLLQSRFARLAAVIALVLIGLLVAIRFSTSNASWHPLALERDQNSEAGPTQVFLFGGENPFRPPYRTHSGSWIEQQGWLLADSTSSRNWINYQLPDWPFYVVEMIARTDDSNLIDIAFGGANAGEKTPQYSVRFQHGQAQLGVLTKIYGSFEPVGQPLELIPGRVEHYLEIQRNEGGWIIQLYRNEDLRRTVPFLGGLNPSNELTLVSQKLKSASDATKGALDSAFSEMSVVRLKLAN